MRRSLIIVVFLCFAGSAHAQCSGTGLAGTCNATATQTQVLAEIAALSDGATLTFSAGSYTITIGTGSVWAAFDPTKSITVACATAPNSIGSASSNQCLMQGVGPTFGSDTFTGTNKKSYRITGFTFDLGGSAPGTGTLDWSCYNGPCPAVLEGPDPNNYGGVRVDHNTFQNGSGGAQTTLIGSNDPGARIDVYGVYDHNLWTNASQFAAIMWAGLNPTTILASSLGTVNNIFLEDNQMTYTNMSTANASQEGCIDGWGGAAFVARHNTTVNCLWNDHGVQHSGGPRNLELYDNSISMNTGANGSGYEDCTECLHSQGSGTYAIFGNVVAQASGQSHSAGPFQIQHYRDFGSSSTVVPYDQCDGLQAGPYADGGSDGNRSTTATNRGYPCWHQPSRTFAGVLTPIYYWNNKWLDDSSVAVLNMVNNTGDTPDYHTNHLQNNRDYYVSSTVQTTSSSPFDGTTGTAGIGFGSAANRPSTCTDPNTQAGDAGHGGVGYASVTTYGTVGASNTSGTADNFTLYNCPGGTAWTSFYAPYIYPHPLVGGGGSGATTDSVTGITMRGVSSQ